MPKQPTSFRLEEETIASLEFLAGRMKRSQAGVIEELVRDRMERERADQQEARIEKLEQRVEQLEQRAKE